MTDRIAVAIPCPYCVEPRGPCAYWVVAVSLLCNFSNLPGSLFSEPAMLPGEACEPSTTRATEPDNAALEPTLQIAAAPVLPDERDEHGQQGWHGRNPTALRRT